VTFHSPVAFQRVCAAIETLYEADPDLCLSLSDIADMMHAPMQLCAGAAASLVNARVLKWSNDHLLIREDAVENAEQRRTA